MTAEQLLGALFDPSVQLGDDVAGVAALAREGRWARAWEEAGLAHGEWLDRSHVDEDEAREQSLNPSPMLFDTFVGEEPGARGQHSNGEWTVRFELQAAGGWLVRLSGPTSATLEHLGGRSVLRPGVTTLLRAPFPPSLVALRLEGGRVLGLRRIG